MSHAAIQEPRRFVRRRWCSLHFYATAGIGIYDDGFDDVVMRALQCTDALPFRRRTDPRFFVRYTDPRHHVRVRIRAPIDVSDDDVLRAVHVSLRNGSSTNIDRVSAELYEPEVLRYGGPHGIRVAERVFVASSRSVGRSLAALRCRPRSTRLGIAVSLAFTTIYLAAQRLELTAAIARAIHAGAMHAVPEDQKVSDAMAAATDAQTAGIASVLRSIHHALDQGERVAAPFDVFQHAWSRAVGEYTAAAQLELLQFEGMPVSQRPGILYRIVPSLVHMTNNRLGVSRLEEAFIAHVVSAVCERLTVPSPLG